MVRAKVKTDEVSVARVQELHDKIDGSRTELISDVDEAIKAYFDDIKGAYKEAFKAELSQLGPNAGFLEFLMKGSNKNNIVIHANQKEVRWPITGEILFSLNGTPVRTQ
uniref:Transposase n=1 Tax=Panagrellus redivivus TaxID=6233 RepID=A0A7E5A0G3_PANRE